MKPLESVVYPNYETLVKIAKRKLEENFKEKSNSWMGFTDIHFWKEKLQEEVDEIWEAESSEEMDQEIADVLNIIAMIYMNSFTLASHSSESGM